MAGARKGSGGKGVQEQCSKAGLWTDVEAHLTGTTKQRRRHAKGEDKEAKRERERESPGKALAWRKVDGMASDRDNSRELN